MITLKEAKKWLRDNFDKGCKCPACGQHVQLYKRKLNSGMALVLIRLYKEYPDDWVPVKEWLRIKKYKNNHDWTMLKYWELIEEKKNDDPKKKSNGYWRITNKGKNFVNFVITVPTHIHIYNKKFRGYSEEHTNIKNALKNHFDYEELMKG